MSAREDGREDARIHALSSSERLPIPRLPGKEFECEIITPVGGAFDVAPVVNGDGKPQVGIIPYLNTSGQQFWPCAVCEQFHPFDVKRCPIKGPMRTVVMGPLRIDNGEPFYLPIKVGTERQP